MHNKNHNRGTRSAIPSSLREKLHEDNDRRRSLPSYASISELGYPINYHIPQSGMYVNPTSNHLAFFGDTCFPYYCEYIWWYIDVNIYIYIFYIYANPSHLNHSTYMSYSKWEWVLLDSPWIDSFTCSSHQSISTSYFREYGTHRDFLTRAFSSLWP